MATLWTESAVAALVVSMRLYVRAQTRTVSWDDWLMFITLVLPRVKLQLERELYVLIKCLTRAGFIHRRRNLSHPPVQRWWL